MFHVIAETGLEKLASTASSIFRQLDILNNPGEVVNSLEGLPLLAGGILCVLGLLCMINGYRWHKWVVILFAGIMGLGIGHFLSLQMGRSLVVAIAVGLLFAAIATPMLKFSVAILGGITGAFIGANAWTAIGAEDPQMSWVGAIIGFILLALTSFLLTRLVIMLFTSIGGAAMFLAGGLVLLLHVDGWQSTVEQQLTQHQLILPLLVVTAAVVGFVIQESRQRSIAEEDD